MAPTSTQTPKTPALPFRTRKLRSSASTNKENGSGSSPLFKVKRTPTKVKQRENSPLKHVSAGTSPGKPTSPVKRVIELQNQISPGPRKSPRKILGELSASASASPSTLSGSPSTPRAKKQLFRRDTSQFSEAKQALSTAVPEVLIGRQKELAVMKRFLQDAWDPKKSGTSKRSLYVSGAPGTGKTACLSYLLKSLEDVKKVFLNCMALKSSKNVFEKIALLLDPSYDGPQAKAQKFIEERLLKSGKGQPILLVLDEIDQLDSKCQEILYTLFEWPHLKGSNLALVGIANALDLTDRILPRLKVKN